MTRLAQWVLVCGAITAAVPAIQGAEPKPIAEFSTEGLVVERLEFSPDGAYLAVAASEPAPEPTPGEKVLDYLKILKPFSTGSFLSYRRPTASLKVWDLARKNAILALDHGANRLFAFSANGKRFACSGADWSQLEIWDLTTTPPTNFRKIPMAEGWETPAFSPDGKLLVTGEDRARLWKLDEAEDPVEIFGSPCGPFAFDSAGRRLAFATLTSGADVPEASEAGFPEMEVAFCETADPTRITRLAKGTFLIEDLRFAADDTKVEFLTLEDSKRGFLDWTHSRRTVEIATKNVSAGPPRRSREEQDGLKTGRTKAGTPLLAIITDKQTVQLVHAENGRVVGEFMANPKATPALAWSFDGKRLATGGLTEARVWDVDSLPVLPPVP